jgi:hypothetical protein
VNSASPDAARFRYQPGFTVLLLAIGLGLGAALSAPALVPVLKGSVPSGFCISPAHRRRARLGEAGAADARPLRTHRGRGVPVGQSQGLDRALATVSLYAAARSLRSPLRAVRPRQPAGRLGLGAVRDGAEAPADQPVRLRAFNIAATVALVATLWPLPRGPSARPVLRNSRRKGQAAAGINFWPVM